MVSKLKSILNSLLDFLDRKFPDQVTVTLADYLALKAQMGVLEKILEKYSDERLKAIEAEVAKFNVALGFGIKEVSKMGPWSR